MNIHSRTDNVFFQFNLSTDGGSNYNVTKTSSSFFNYHNEADTATSIYLDDVYSLDQSTGVQVLTPNAGSDADQSISGSLLLFNPSSTTYVKHYISNIDNYHNGDYAHENFLAGYANTTSAVNAITFNMSSGNMDGIIYLYGIK